MRLGRITIGLAAALALTACSVEAPSGSDDASGLVQVENADWARDAVIYQLNTRHFTSEGTFAAAQEQLPRLAEMGVDIVWLMPIHPIGEEKRKGGMGSPYSVLDYRAVNPDLGTEEEFRAFVDIAHEQGLKVILDWVANHSAWDNALVAERPEWYTKTPEGEMMPPAGTDWSDVVDFDFSNPEMREYMTESLVYWVREFDIDGYRADVAGYVPLDFWNDARAELDAVKPVFMLAEWDERDMHYEAFDATYAWSWKEVMQDIAKGEADASAMRGYFTGQQLTWPHEGMRMMYTDNHDQNSWDGVASEIYGPAYETAIALSFTAHGIPLIYNGQEADLDRQLAFFEKDEIEWKTGQYEDLFRRLIALKTQESALWNGRWGAPMIDVRTNADENVFAFVRGEGADRMFAVFNLSPGAQQVTFDLARHHGTFTDAMTGEERAFNADAALALEPWGYRIFTAN